MSVSNLISITTLYLDSNCIEGEINFPQAPHQLQSLGFLRLEDNKLIGSIPASFGYLASIRRVSLGKNKLEGVISPNLRNLRSLEEMYLEKNLFSGQIPPSFSQLSHLILLNISHILIQGPLPEELSSLRNLQMLDVSFNSLNIPFISKWIGELPSLSKLFMAGCGIQGGIPELLPRTPSSLQELDLSGNKINGSLPLWLGELTQLYSLNLSRNSLSSTLPDTLANLHLFVFWIFTPTS